MIASKTASAPCAALALLLIASLASGCVMSEQYRLERATALAEKREQYAYERRACEASTRGAWMCTSGSERAREDYPWLHCSCTDNRSVLGQ